MKLEGQVALIATQRMRRARRFLSMADCVAFSPNSRARHTIATTQVRGGFVAHALAFMRRWAISSIALCLALAAVPAFAQELSYKYASVDGINIFYREAGHPGQPTLLLLHGIPTSSQMFRDLIPRLAGHFHVIAPDFVGMGYSDAPKTDKFVATQENLTAVMEKFVQQTLNTRVILYMQDLGGPIGMRLATRHPEWIAGLIFQNTPISMAGWNPERLKPLLANTGPITEDEKLASEHRDLLAAAIFLYKHGARQPDRVNPDAWAIDAYALGDPEKKRIIADYLADARLSFALYPSWQAYLRQYKPATLVVWGTQDPVFAEAGVKDIQAAVPSAKVHLYNTGHFALEEDGDDIAQRIIDTFGR